MNRAGRTAAVAWLVTALYYFYQYTLRSAPSVMIPDTVIKEVNPPEMGGTATGVVNFLNFTCSALLGPVFGWLLLTVSSGAAQLTISHYQTTFQPLLYGVALAIALVFFLEETGPAVRRTVQ